MKSSMFLKAIILAFTSAGLFINCAKVQSDLKNEKRSVESGFVTSSGGTTNFGNAILDTSRDSICHDIFNRLKKVKGLGQIDFPVLKIVNKLSNDQFRLAMANPETGIIELERETLNLCFDQMGEDGQNGLAYILAHEISHITREHSVRHRFIEKFQKDLNQEEEVIVSVAAPESGGAGSFLHTIDSLAIKYRIRRNEAEADFDAGFTSHLAGFPTGKAGPMFLEKSYEQFNIDTSSGNYASLSERQMILSQIGRKVDSLIHVYNMANYLNIAGAYKEALECYNLVSRTFQSAELLNNMGVLCIQELTGIINIKDVKYVLPLTLSLADGGGKSADEEERRALYKSQMDLCILALSYFEKANAISPNFYPAHLNRSITYYLLNVVKNSEKEFSTFVGDEKSFCMSSALMAKQAVMSVSIINEKALSDVYAQLAIASHVQGDASTAVNYNTEALHLNEDNRSAMQNEDVLKGIGDVTAYLLKDCQPADSDCTQKETFFNQGLSFGDILGKKIMDNWNMGILLKTVKGRWLDTKTKVFYFDGPDYEYYAIITMGINKRIDHSFFIPKDNYKFATSCGIMTLDTQVNMEEAYGDSSRKLEFENGTLVRYKSTKNLLADPTEGVIFKLRDNIIENWIAYEIFIN